VVSPNGSIVYEPQQGTYKIHTVVTLTANPFSDYEFINWSGDYESADTTITIVMDSTMNLVANYRKLPYYRLDVYSSKGEVTKFPNSSRYVSGFTVELTATPSSGYKFESWSGDYVGTDNPLYLTMSENMELFANFVPQTTAIESVNNSTIKVFPNPNDGVFTIQLDGQFSATYKLLNICGELVQSGIVDPQQKIEVKEKRSGIYLLEVNNSNEHKMLKMIVN
jgi:hypothetical protein